MISQRRRLRRVKPKQNLVANPFSIPIEETTTGAATTTETSRVPSITVTSPTSKVVSPSGKVDQVEDMSANPFHGVIASLGTVPTKTKSTKQSDGACSHISVTRLYTNEHVCHVCYSHGAFGWLYRCTQDRELLIEHDIKSGVEVTERTDDLYKTLPDCHGVRKGSPEARSSPINLLEEMSEEQFRTYTPTQIATLLKQREHVRNTILSTQAHQNELLDPSIVDLKAASTQPPYLPTMECQFKVCPRCRQSYRDKASISLNAIADSEILPSAAVGFGFHLMGSSTISRSQDLTGNNTHQDQNHNACQQSGRPVIPLHLALDIGLKQSPPQKHRRRSRLKRRTWEGLRLDSYDFEDHKSRHSIDELEIDLETEKRVEMLMRESSSKSTKRASPLRIFDAGWKGEPKPWTDKKVGEMDRNDEEDDGGVSLDPAPSQAQLPAATTTNPANITNISPVIAPTIATDGVDDQITNFANLPQLPPSLFETKGTHEGEDEVFVVSTPSEDSEEVVTEPEEPNEKDALVELRRVVQSG